MKISETNVNFGRQAYVKEAESSSAQEVARSRQSEIKKEIPEDKVSLSANAKDMKVASDAVAAAPDMRINMVQAVKPSVDDGTYQINPEKIAEKMIGFNINQIV